VGERAEQEGHWRWRPPDSYQHPNVSPGTNAVEEVAFEREKGRRAITRRKQNSDQQDQK
jgi:hypothetical protein